MMRIFYHQINIEIKSLDRDLSDDDFVDVHIVEFL